jgi:hypothetical protein
VPLNKVGGQSPTIKKPGAFSNAPKGSFNPVKSGGNKFPGGNPGAKPGTVKPGAK